MISLQPPFYPYEAELKGANPEEYGSVFGAFYLGAFITCPIGNVQFFIHFMTVFVH